MVWKLTQLFYAFLQRRGSRSWHKLLDMIRLSSSLGLATRAMRLAPRAMRLAPVRARHFATPVPTSTGKASVDFGVHLTGGRRTSEKVADHGAYAYVYEEATNHNECWMDAFGIFSRADASPGASPSDTRCAHKPSLCQKLCHRR